jgi:NADH:ubiquinone oxidoreductase subunit E
MANWLETLWGNILSRDAKRVQEAINSIEDVEERLAIIAHLHKMATEQGWSDPQRISAQHALKALHIDY